MLADKDPIALGLYVKYREVSMQNLKLTDAHVAAVIDYLQAQSARGSEVFQRAGRLETDGASGSRSRRF
jgi:cytochrome c1